MKAIAAICGLFACFAFALGMSIGAVSFAHPPGKFGLEVQVLDFQRDADNPALVHIDLQVFNDSGQAKTLRGFRAPDKDQVAQVVWTRGKFDVPGRFARIDAGETWRLGNRFNLLALTLADGADLAPDAVHWIEMDFGRDQVVDVRFTQEGVNGVDWSDEANWFVFDLAPDQSE